PGDVVVWAALWAGARSAAGDSRFGAAGGMRQSGGADAGPRLGAAAGDGGAPGAGRGAGAARPATLNRKPAAGGGRSRTGGVVCRLGGSGGDADPRCPGEPGAGWAGGGGW